MNNSCCDRFRTPPGTRFSPVLAGPMAASSRLKISNLPMQRVPVVSLPGDGVPTTVVLWGANPQAGVYYAARVHVVSSQYADTGLCGLPVELVWERRPETTHRPCPECCLLLTAWFFPVAEQQRPLLNLAGTTDLGGTAPLSTSDTKRNVMSSGASRPADAAPLEEHV
ncbi:hypothetical protein [Actinosynnema sp. ALI-1.44]|uniref:hypothetical protein n=1 Tax=Actinosynnema sp. ALI-1.44 TaxID=1933779 RepID=UPI0011773B87|nr:hypothetical protein [Actinosynnema sp. ALI-1.44]